MHTALFRSALLLALATSTAAATAGEMRPYLRAAIGADMAGDTTFRDADCASKSPKALFGCGDGSDGKTLGAYGDFGSSVMLEAAAGLEVTDYLRLEAAFSYRPGFAFDGNANFRSSGADQPVSGDVTQMGAMAFAYVEPLTAMGVKTPLRPFLGAGVGVSHNEIGEMTYEFPALKSPLYSITPGGSSTEFAWAITAGLSYDLADRLVLDLAWRYSDFGEVRTDQGNLFVRTVPNPRNIEIGETEAELTSHAVTLSARWRF